MSAIIPSTDLVIFAGRFGGGKSEVAINYTLFLARHAPGVSQLQPGSEENQPTSVILIDLDIVTPYFRSREAAGKLLDLGVKVIAPSVIGQHLDTPAITPQILGAIQQSDLPVVLDVGGDKQGARALGQFSPAIRERKYTMHFVVNPYRPFTDTLDGLRDSIGEIEASSRLEVSSLVSNPNLIRDTTIEQIVEGHAKIERFAQALNLPIAFISIERQWIETLTTSSRADFSQPMLLVDRQFVMSWE